MGHDTLIPYLSLSPDFASNFSFMLVRTLGESMGIQGLGSLLSPTWVDPE